MKYVYKNNKTYKFTKKLKIYLTILLAVLISTTGYLISNDSFSKFNDYQTIFNEETEDGINVVVDAKPNTIPKNSTLEIEKITDESEEAIKESINEVKGDKVNIVNSYTYDICILDKNGNEIEPSSDVKISFQSDEINNKNLDTKIYHTTTDEDNTIEKTEKLKEKVVDDTVTATTDSFSYYTVAFTYNDKTYNLGGDEEVKLDEILNTLELEGEVTKVESSNNELFYPELREDGYYIVSIAPFDTEEYLNVTIDNIVYKIDVTDATKTGSATGGTITVTYTTSSTATQTTITVTKVVLKATKALDFTMFDLSWYIAWYQDNASSDYIDLKTGTYKKKISKGSSVTLFSGTATKTVNKIANDYSYLNITVHLSSLESGWTTNGPDVKLTSSAMLAKYTIKYDANGGSGAPDTGYKWYNKAYTVPSTKPTKTGYNFTNWKITQTGNTVGAGETITAGSNNNYDLVAQWSEKTATLTYANGGHGTAPANATMKYTTATNAAGALSATGYTFTGWKRSDTGAVIAAGAQVKAANVEPKAITLTAQWSEKTATLTYANGGHGTAPGNATMKYSAATNAASAISATGYTFTGWKRSDTGAVIAAGAQVKAANVEPAALTLTAQWTAKSYTLTWNLAGGKKGSDAGPINYTVTYGEQTSNARDLPIKTGYVCTGMYDSSNNKVFDENGHCTTNGGYWTATYANGGRWKYDGNLTVTAKYTANTYTIGYTLNGGNNPSTKPTSGTYDTDVVISNPTKTVTVTGNANSTGATVGAAQSKAQTFSGWTSTTLGSNAKTGTAANPTTAWSGSSTKNTYFRNLRESGTATMVANWTPVAVTLPTLSKTGYTCKWYTDATGGSLMGSSGGSWTPGANSAAAVTAYARCTENTATLTYANGGHGTAPSNVTMKYSAATNAAGALTATGYNFTGWKRSDNSTIIAAGAQVKAANVNPTALTLTAQWSEKTATLTYNNGGHGTAPGNATMKYTTATNAASAISAAGYAFAGWKRSDTGAVIAAGAQVKAANVEPTALTLTAQWTPYKLTLKYHVNGGTITTDTSQATRWRANSSLVQRSTDSGSTWADITAVLNTDTTTADLWNVGTYNAKKTGYSISGTKAYNTKADGTGVNINQDHNASSSPDNAPTVARINGGALTADKTMNIYINWVPNTYTIGYTLNGGTKGTNGPTSGTYDKDVQISNPTKTVTVTGNVNNTGATIGAAQSKAQTFSGWTSTTLGSNAKTGTAANPTTAWSGSSTKNTYFRNLRESGTVTMVANWTPVAVTLPTLSKAGHSCSWYTASTGGSLMGGSGASWTPGATSNAAVTAYARCTENTATLTYNNGGHGTAPANATMKYSAATNAASAITATGYNFTGWKRSDTGAVIAAGAQVKAANVNPTALTLTAQWSEKTATLTYNNGGHGTAPGNATMKYTTATNAASALSATGYTFNGWKRSDNNTVIAAGAQVKAANVEPSALTLTAQWTANTYTIGYTLNGGNNPSTKPTSGTYDQDVQISNPTKTVTVTGNENSSGATVGNATSKAQTFSGWTSTTLGSNAKTGTAANPTTAWSGSSTKNTYFRNLRESGTVTMVANWTPVAFNLPTATKTGYTCKWYSSSGTSGGNLIGTSGGSYTPSATSAASVTVYARCTNAKLTVTQQVKGSIANTNKEFNYTLNVKNNGTNISGTYAYTGTRSGNLTFTNGNATFKLKHGQNIAITFPSDYTYTITQVNDGYTVSKTNDSGTLSSDKTASFTNTLEGTTPTGIFTDIFPYVLLLVCGIGFVIWIKRFKYI